MIINGTKLSMIRGDTESITVTINNAQGEMIPLVDGDTVYFTLKKNPRNETKVIQKVETVFIDGMIDIVLTHDDTKTIDFGEYYYDVQVSYANGTVRTVLGPDTFTLLEDVTHE